MKVKTIHETRHEITVGKFSIIVMHDAKIYVRDIEAHGYGNITVDQADALDLCAALRVAADLWGRYHLNGRSESP